jgi:hypothetical protein
LLELAPHAFLAPALYLLEHGGQHAGQAGEE